KKKSRSINGFLTRYFLNPWTLLDGERLKRVAFGDKDESKPHKTIIMLGETGVGKSTIINALVNYMLGVESEDRIWFEIIETEEKQADSQTVKVTAYDIFTESSSFSLTIIDTPGFDKTEGKKEDLKIAEGLLELFGCNDWHREIDAVCLVMSSSTVRLTERQRCIFNSILSLFSNDVKNNFVVFITHAPTASPNSIKAIKDAKIPCAQTDNKEPVHFRFDNCHCENFYVKCNSEEQMEQLFQGYQAAWDLFKTSIEDFWHFVKGSKPVSIQNTQSVLIYRKQLLENITSIRKEVHAVQHKEMLDQAIEALQHHKEKEKNITFTYEVDEEYTEKVPIDPSSRSSKEATCCSVCKFNCHYPGCWWVRNLSWCTVMSNNKCTVCPGKCDYTKHVKEGKIYVRKTRKVKKTNEEQKKDYVSETEEHERRINQLQEEISTQEKKITTQVNKCLMCLNFLQKIALNTDALCTVQDLDGLIEEAKKKKHNKIIEALEQLK
ncbi:hypothetical protein C0J45_3721, partial [Silurus meridionalis]